MVATSWIVTLGLGIWSGSGMAFDPVLAATPGFAGMKQNGAAYTLAVQTAAASERSRDEAYDSGREAIDAGRFAEAAETFRKLAAEAGEDADRALFWQAYSEAKASRSADALSTLKRLKAEHPGSPWLDDAKALEVEVRGTGASAGAVKAEDDEELKLYVLDGLMSSDSERAVPMLLKFIAGNHSDRLKERALFVLSQSDSPEAYDALLKIARGNDQPRLQLEAIRVLGTSGEETAVKALEEVYRSSTNREVKEEALRGFLVADAKAPLVRLAKDEKDTELRAEAIRQLGAMEATAELGQLYASETSRELKLEILRSLGVAGEVSVLSKAARQESDPELKAEAIRSLGINESEESAAALVELYRQGGDRKVKEAALEALFIQDNAKALLSIFKSETDRELKREALKYLSMLEDDETDELLDSILNDEN